MAKPKAEYTVTLNEQPMTQEEISAKYVENSKKYLQQQIDFYKKLNQLKRNEMNSEVAINMNGVVVEVIAYPERITFEKGEQFESEMANTIEVIVGDKEMTLAEARRKWMHDKLDNWIDGVEE